MKNFKIILLSIIGLFITSCDLDEDPIFLDSNAVYSDINVAKGALDGIYQALTSYNAQERRIFAINGFSGLFAAGKNGGNNVNNINNANLFSLKPTYDADTEAMWGGVYSAIARCNGAIHNIVTVNEPTTSDQSGFNDIAGQAYFVRAWSYFSLTRLWGDVPLWLSLPNNENLHLATTSSKDVYAQIIADAQMALTLMNGSTGIGYPKQYAANMLLAKVYMTLATNPDLRADGISEMDYWQLAYEQAIEVYGQYSLVADYGSLFTDTNENSSESIWELQISQDAANSQMGRNFTPWKYKLGQHFGWLRVHADVYNHHESVYPNDPRLEGTYLHSYQRADNGNTVTVYPSNPNRPNFSKAHPYFFKFTEKDTQHSNQYGDQNLIIYRYGELLIMLAEISNELDNGQQLGFVTELLSRVGMSPQGAYFGTQEEFREAIMYEYRFEVLGEGEDAHNNRRRGFDNFLNRTILFHNNNPIHNPSVDLTLSTDPSQVMSLPIPLIEINTNELIDLD